MNCDLNGPENFGTWSNSVSEPALIWNLELSFCMLYPNSKGIAQNGETEGLVTQCGFERGENLPWRWEKWREGGEQQWRGKEAPPEEKSSGEKLPVKTFYLKGIKSHL